MGYLVPCMGAWPPEDHALRDSLIANFEEFLRFFEARNLTRDGELARLVEQARSVIHNLTPEELRANGDLRREVQQAMAGIKDAMDAGAMLKPTRRFTLVPEGVPA